MIERPAPHVWRRASLWLGGLALVAALPAAAETQSQQALTADAAPEPESMAEPPPDTVNIRAYRELIDNMEIRRGAYADGLSEPLLSLGLALHEQQRFAEAADAFKRGVHLSRINQGLYNSGQIPLVRGLINSYMAMGEWELADEKQDYLFRVQRRALSGREDMSRVFMQHATWQYDAYRMDLQSDGFVRLLSMWDYYRMAASDIAEREGANSTRLLPPLQGLLRTQYLIARHQLSDSAGNNPNDFNAQQQYGRFTSIQSRSYNQGRAVIRAIFDVYNDTEGAGSPLVADTMVKMGDWMWFNGERTAATSAYREAIAELEGSDTAKEELQRHFGQPVPLPDIDGVRPLPTAGTHGEDRVLLEYAVNEHGRVTDLELLDGDEERARPLMRSLRRTRFRPRFEDLQPVETPDIQVSYAY